MRRAATAEPTAVPIIAGVPRPLGGEEVWAGTRSCVGIETAGAVVGVATELVC
jgi:hypothetical protein